MLCNLNPRGSAALNGSNRLRGETFSVAVSVTIFVPLGAVVTPASVVYYLQQTIKQIHSKYLGDHRHDVNYTAHRYQLFSKYGPSH